MSGFPAALLAWHAIHGRRDLPWLLSRDPYRVWLSEIMLQQTQVATVLGYYERFLERFPTVGALAAADLDEVMPLWAGLGYYARARHLHACARRVVDVHGGVFPRSAEALARLPGIGRSTAAAIAAFCFDAREPILDGNVKRVLARCFGIDGDPGAAAVERRLWSLAADLLPERPADMPAYTQAVMDLGATVCTRARPACDRCPLAGSCVALRDGRTAALPAPRLRRSAPLRSAHLLVALHDGRVLLEQRPARGLWGGLLTLPQFDEPAALQRALRWLSADAAVEILPMRRHAFTHFTLEFTPHVARIATQAPRAGEPGERWLPLTAVEELALPAPIRRLLREVRDGGAGGILPPVATGARRARAG